MFGEIIILLVLLVFSAFFSGIEIAFFSLSHAKIKTMVNKKLPYADLVDHLKSEPRKLLTTILVYNNMVNIGAAALATSISLRLFGSYGVGIATGIMTVLILIFGEITPKAFATRNAALVARYSAKPLRVLQWILAPVIYIFTKMTSFMLSMQKTKGQPLVTEEELKTMVDIGVQEGEVHEQEKRIIEKVFLFNDILAEDIMTPRTEIICYDANAILKDVIEEIIRGPSRVPVFNKNRDNIIGILYVRDVLKALHKRKTNVTLKSLACEPIFVPESKVINELMKEFQEKHVHMAIVVDEFGGTAGLATMEDIIEELVGEIADETDISKELIKRLDKNEILVHGTTEISDVNDFFNVRLPGKGTDTINSFILQKLHKIPRKGVKLEINNMILTVEEASKRKVVKVLIEKKEK
ncbi:MAG: hemolysin family protein [archaeon]